MASSQKRMLTAPNSKIAKADITRALRKEDAWITLPLETRIDLYAQLPEPKSGEPPHDPEIHPLKTIYKQYIETELRRWQEDLKDGREAPKWRNEALQASQDRLGGKFDEWKEMQREEYWGQTNNENAKEGDKEPEVLDSQDEK